MKYSENKPIGGLLPRRRDETIASVYASIMCANNDTKRR